MPSPMPSPKPSFSTSEYLLTCMQWRYAVKKFDSERKIPKDQWAALEQAIALSPSSYGLQPWLFLVIQNKAIRQRLFLASMGQRKVVDCSHLVVFAARTDITELDISRWGSRLAEVRHIPELELAKMHSVMSGDLVIGHRHAIAGEWAKRQVYLALGIFLASAAVTGIDTCPMEGFDPKAYDDILELTARGYTTAVVATAGYRSSDDTSASEAKVRYPTNDVVITL